jgi:hypothetical protein
MAEEKSKKDENKKTDAGEKIPVNQFIASHETKHFVRDVLKKELLSVVGIMGTAAAYEAAAKEFYGRKV